MRTIAEEDAMLDDEIKLTAALKLTPVYETPEEWGETRFGAKEFISALLTGMGRPLSDISKCMEWRPINRFGTYSGISEGWVCYTDFKALPSGEYLEEENSDY